VQKQAGHRSIGKLAAAAAAAAGAIGLVGAAAAPVQAGLLLDFRATAVNGVPVSSGHGYIVPQDGDVVYISLYARVQGANAANDEAFQSITGSIFSSGPTRGNLGQVTLVAPFNGLGSQNGSQQDFDSDGDLDIGSIPTGSRPMTNSLYLLARSSAPQDGAGGTVDGVPIAGADPAAEEWLIAKMFFTVTSTQGYAFIDFVRRQLPNGQNDVATAVWREEGTFQNGTSPYSTNPLVIGIPEPSVAALAGLASLGLLARRKRS
jgi:hypothetical protein